MVTWQWVGWCLVHFLQAGMGWWIAQRTPSWQWVHVWMHMAMGACVDENAEMTSDIITKHDAL